MHANCNGSVHAEHHGMSLLEQWAGEKPDLQRYPILPFGTIMMAHIPVSQQSAGGQRSNVTYCVGTSLLHKKGLKSYNPQTKKEIIRGTFKTIGIERPPSERLTYEINADDHNRIAYYRR